MASSSIPFDDVLPLIGEFGKFQVILQVMLCIGRVVLSYPTLIMYFAALQPEWKCALNSTVCLSNQTFAAENRLRCDMPRNAWEYTKPSEYSIATHYDIYCSNQWKLYMSSSVLFIGSGIGAVVLGWAADTYGRKKVMFPSLAVVLIVGFASSFSPTIWLFTLFRFVVGFFIPGATPQMFVLVSELSGPRYRAAVGITYEMFFAIAMLIMGAEAYFLRSWKMLFVLCTAPYVFVLIFYFFVPESVRWLLAVGRTNEAMKIVRKVARCNGRNLSPDICMYEPHSPDNVKNVTLFDLLAERATTVSTIIQGQGWLVFAMVYFGLSLASDDLGGSLYLNFVLSAIVEIPASFVAIYSCDRFGRRRTVTYSMMLGGISCALVAAFPATGRLKALRVFVGILGKFCVSLSYDAMHTWSVELYPTRIRSLGMGFLQLTSRVGAASAPWVAQGLMSLSQALPFVFMGILSVLSSCLLFWLPETNGQTADNILEEKSKLIKSYQAISNSYEEVL